MARGIEAEEVLPVQLSTCTVRSSEIPSFSQALWMIRALA